MSRLCCPPAVLAMLVILAQVPCTARADVSVTGLVVSPADDPSMATRVVTGLRRGLRQRQGVQYVHPGELVSRRDAPGELFEALDDLDPIAELIRAGEGAEAGRRADAAIQIFESNLDLVPRRQLLDAYMLAAVARCASRRRSDCVSRFESIVTFREGAEYDLERYPEAYADLFAETQLRVVAEGERGSLSITTVPHGAEVFVDGRSIGPSPAVADGLLLGRHYVNVRALGYSEFAVRATVAAQGMTSVQYMLSESENALIVQQNIPRLRREVGRDRAGPAIRAIDGYLPVAQVVLAVVEAATPETMRVALYVYDLRTNFLLAHTDAVVGRSSEGTTRVQELVAELYEDVDLSGRVEAPEEVIEPGESYSVLEQWWFWTALAVVVASGVTAAVFLAPSDPAIPQGFIRLDGSIE